ARKDLDLFLLVVALDVERRGVRARVHLALAHHDEFLAAVADLLPRGALSVERVARLVDVREQYGVADRQRSRIGLFAAGDHAEQRRLAGAVGADDADDSA